MTAYKRPVFFDRDLKSFSELSADSGLDLGVVARSILADSYLQVGTTDSAGTVSVKNAYDAERIKLDGVDGKVTARIVLAEDTLQAGTTGYHGGLSIRNALNTHLVSINGTSAGGQFFMYSPDGAEVRASLLAEEGGSALRLRMYGEDNAEAINIDGATGSITLSAATSKLTGLVTAEITQPLDAVNKAYVDSIAQGLAIKGACHVSSQANIEVLATTTEVDGHTLVEGERVLVRYQADQIENGIYRFNGTGLVRSDDMAAGSHAAGAFTFVQFGTNADQGWVCTADAPADVVGTDALPWTQFSAAGVIEAGDGLQLIGTVMSAKLDGTTLSASVDGLKVLGLPEMFEVGGVAVSATVTAPALDTLTAGFASDARLLHAHSCSRNTLPAATPTLASKAVVVESSGYAVAAGTSSAGAWVVGYCTQVIDESAYVIRSGIADGTLVGATPGDVYYVQADGTIGTALPSEGRVIMIGVAISEFDLFVQIRDFGAILAA